MSITVTQINSPDDQPEDFQALVEVCHADRAVRNPDDPPSSPAEIAADVFVRAPGCKGVVFVARIDGVAAGAAWTFTESEPGDENQVSFVEVLVNPRLKRQGVATSLLQQVVPSLIQLGQNSIVAYVCAEVAHEAGVALCEKLGLTPRLEERCSRVDVGQIDEELMASWIADAVVRAEGYRLEQWEGVCPEPLAQPWSEAVAAMEDEPTDELDLNLFTRTVDEQRELDEGRRSSGFRLYRSLVLSPEGEAAAMSMMLVHRDRPQIGHQGDTGVLAAHRGKRIGRWVKAVNYQLVRQAHPELRAIETYNAQSNAWMLDINVAMGFRPHHLYTAYQGSIDEVAAALG